MTDIPRIDVSRVDRTDVIKALFSRARPVGLGHPHFRQNSDAEVEKMITEHVKRLGWSFDYLQGRSMKVHIFDDGTFVPLGYNRDNGDALSVLQTAGLDVSEVDG